MTNKYKYLILFFSILFLSSCADDMVRQFDSIPSAFGKVNEVTILADQQMWDGPLGDTMDYYYTGAFPITPTPEPMLDLRHFNHNEISRSTVFKHYRSYIILANLSKKDSEITAEEEKNVQDELKSLSELMEEIAREEEASAP